jgi:transposase
MSYRHHTVNHSVEFVTDAGIHSNTIENLWGHMKADLKYQHGTSKALLPGILDEFVFHCRKYPPLHQP